MPCYDSRSDPSYVREEAVAEARKSFLHNSPVAELLCYVLTNTVPSKRAPLLAANSKLAHWWADHQERDRKVAADKVAAEKKRKADIRSQIKKMQDQL